MNANLNGQDFVYWSFMQDTAICQLCDVMFKEFLPIE